MGEPDASALQRDPARDHRTPPVAAALDALSDLSLSMRGDAGRMRPELLSADLPEAEQVVAVQALAASDLCRAW